MAVGEPTRQWLGMVGSARQRREVGARTGLWAGLGRGRAGQLGRAERKEGQRPHGPAEKQGGGRLVGLVGQNQGRERKNKGFPFSFMK
jgi:hypothetical protein